MRTKLRDQAASAPTPDDPALEGWWGRHPQEDGEPVTPHPVPELGDIVPNRHSASAEAAWLRWRETHEDS